MEKLGYIEKEINDIKLDQSRTSQEIVFLAKEVDSHIQDCKEVSKKDDERHLEQQSALAKLTESTSTIASNIDQFIPEARKEFKIINQVVAKQEAHGWLLKSIVSIVIAAALGSFVTSAMTCNLSSLQQQIEEVNNKTNFHPAKIDSANKRRQSMNSTEAFVERRSL